jgi:hypothetical protein
MKNTQIVSRESQRVNKGKKTSRFKRETASPIYQTAKKKSYGGGLLCSMGINADEMGQAYRNMWKFYADKKGHVSPFSIGAIEYERLYARRAKINGRVARDAYYWKEWKQCFAFMLLLLEVESTYADGFSRMNPFLRKGPTDFVFERTGHVVVPRVRKAPTKWARANERDEYFKAPIQAQR